MIYQGGKRAFAEDIINLIKPFLADNTPFYELFVGGHNIYPYLLNGARNVVCSDIIPYASALIDYAISQNGELPLFWISKEEFDDIKKNPEDYADWYVGYALYLFSFGTSGTSYFCAKDKEEDKRKTFEYFIKLKDIGVDWRKSTGLLTDYDIDYSKSRAKSFFDEIKSKINDMPNIKTIYLLENLNRIRVIEEDLEKYKGYIRMSEFYYSKNNSNLIFNIKSYDKVDIETGAIVFLDPPYRKTSGYVNQEKFDTDKFDNYCRELSKDHLVFICEFEMPDDFICIWSKDRRNHMNNYQKYNSDGSVNNNYTESNEEKIFIHKCNEQKYYEVADSKVEQISLFNSEENL